MIRKISTRDPEFLRMLTFEPLSKEYWDQFEQLFGVQGACGNCWCMAYRLTRKDFNAGKTDNINKMKMKALVWDGKTTGLLAFYQGQAIGWCALAPRKDFIRLAGSRVHKPIDDRPVWSIPCFFVHKKFRNRGVSEALLYAVIRHAEKNKINVLEAYPVILTKGRLPDAFAWAGLYNTFLKLGFKIVDRTSVNRPMMRYYIDIN
jgi:GNAT superfamily N-acetyltransferase